MKHTFVRKCGAVFQYDRFSESYGVGKLTPGYWWVNTAPLGADYAVWVETIETPIIADDGKLFGIPIDEFMRKQYK